MTPHPLSVARLHPPVSDSAERDRAACKEVALEDYELTGGTAV
jgi:hypothetical protein